MIGELKIVITNEDKMRRHEIPAKKIMRKPDKAIMIDVPKSG